MGRVRTVGEGSWMWDGRWDGATRKKHEVGLVARQ